jgi:hypothetical protein
MWKDALAIGAGTAGAMAIVASAFKYQLVITPTMFSTNKLAKLLLEKKFKFYFKWKLL